MRRHPSIEVLESQCLHRGRVFDVFAESVRLPSGLRQDLDLVVHGGAVCIAAQRADGELVLVRQYRHAAGDWMLEIPAGRLEAGEDPLVAARRELEEETGLRAGHWELLSSFFAAPGFCTEEISLYLARELEPVAGGGLACDADEELEVTTRSPAQLLEEARDAKTLLAAALLTARAPRPSST